MTTSQLIQSILATVLFCIFALDYFLVPTFTAKIQSSAFFGILILYYILLAIISNNKN